MSGDGSSGAPQRIGIDLGAMGERPATRPSHRDCPGALLVITRDVYDAMVQGGEVFATKRKDMPADGSKADARVHCTSEVLSKASSLGGMVHYGLCASCSGLEADLRAELRAKQGQR